MESLFSIEIKLFMLVALKEHELWVSFFILLLFALCSVIVSGLQIVFSNSSYESIAKWEPWQIVGARLAGVSVTKTATLLGVSRAAVSKTMMAYTNNGKTS
jgi:hypothetical protein